MIKYKECFSNKTFITSFIISLVFLACSLFINYYAGNYTKEQASNSVTDIILSNTPTYDLDGIFIYGTYVFWFFFTALCLYEPKKIPFTLKSLALFIIIRSLFISMTHIAPFGSPVIPVIVDPTRWISDFTFGSDLFFSGHTGIPFLMALIYWENKYLRILFILTSIFFGITVLLAHLHYTIDVLSAFFITYTIYHICLKLFKSDYQLSMNPSPLER